MNQNRVVSIIITTKNEEEVIGRLLESLNKQSYKYKEVIVVDNNSQDNTTKVAKKLGAVIFNHGPERSSQRNFGAKRAKGEYLLILDADMELTSEAISESVKEIERDKKIGQIVIPEESKAFNFWGKVKVFERYLYNKEGDELTDAARFFKKSTFFKAGGYDELITGPEDWDLPETIKELGYKSGRIKSKIFHYERINSPFSIACKKFYYALRAHRYLKKHSMSLFGPKTIFFLRPVFYKNWRELFCHPLLTLGMIIMLTLEQIGGTLGYFYGRIFNK